MTGDASADLTASLGGDQEARRRLVALVYDDLRRVADELMARERPEHTLQPTALVHEAYLRLVAQPRVDSASRTHFIALAAGQMRRVLMLHARAHSARQEGSRTLLSPGAEPTLPWENPEELLDLDQALVRLARSNPRAAKVVELRFFGGSSLEEIGLALGVSRETVKLDWRFARAWLTEALARTDKG